LLFLFFSVSAFAGVKPWSAKIRPGFVTGNSDVGTDAYIDILIPLWGDERRLLFFNPNFRVDDNDGNEQNIGLGFRRMGDCGHYILGGNLFYDTMRSEQNQQYHQLGIGVELLSHWFDLRANYYDPFGDTDNVIGGTAASGYYFSGHSLLASGGLETEEALDGFDAEVSLLIPYISKIMESRVAGTYYNFDRDSGDNLDGWRGRLEIRPVQAINLSVEYRDDDARGSDTFFGGYLEIPFSIENLVAGKNPFAEVGDLWKFGQGVRPLNERMTDKVIRDRHIVTASNEGQSGGIQTVVDDQIIFVNQDNEQENPDGSFENPYPTLEQAMEDEARFVPGAWIYVFSSDANADTYANAHVILQDDMVLWGQGYQHPVYGLGGGPLPILDGGYSGGEVDDYASESVIVLADNNEVMGLTVQNGVEGIYGSNIKSTHIHDNLIRWNPDPEQFADASGIHISNLFTPSEVNGQTLNYVITDNQITDNGSVGIYINTEVNNAAQSVSGLTINNEVSRNILYGNYDSSEIEEANGNVYVANSITASNVTNASIYNTFEDNEISRCNGGECENTVTNGIILTNEIDATGGDGNISGSHFYNEFEGNTITDLLGTGILIQGQSIWGKTISNVSSESTFTANTITDNEGRGIASPNMDNVKAMGDGAAVDGAHVIKRFVNNTITDNGYAGVHTNNEEVSAPADNISNSSVEFYFQNNVITGNGYNKSISMYDNEGIYIYADSSTSRLIQEFFMQGNQITGNYGSGIIYYFNGQDQDTFFGDFGGGSLGSTGNNAFADNNLGGNQFSYDISNGWGADFTFSAKNNWWGQAGGPVAGQINTPALFDTSEPLAADPFTP
jgi:hypothetical protein